jgi:hypothetical protein
MPALATARLDTEAVFERLDRERRRQGITRKQLCAEGLHGVKLLLLESRFRDQRLRAGSYRCMARHQSGRLPETRRSGLKSPEVPPEQERDPMGRSTS